MASQKNMPITQPKSIDYVKASMLVNAAFDISKDPIFIKNTQGCFVHVNDAFCQVYGLEKKDLIGDEDEPRSVPYSSKELLAQEREILISGNETVAEESVTVKGQPAKTILTRKYRFTAPDGNKYIVGIGHDITP